MDRGEEQLIALVSEWARYRAKYPEGDIADFCLHYITEHTKPTTDDQYRTHHPDARTKDGQGSDEQALYNERWVESLSGESYKTLVAIRPEARLGALVGRLSKYSYFYSKKAMQRLDFRSIDDPVYLIVLVQMGTPKKSELIYEMMSEFASGIDIVNRLIRMGLVEEFPDEHDKRSKRLRITAKGVEVIQQCFPVMNQVADVAYSSLTDGEKALLVQILDKLDRYHAEHYRQTKNADFDEVYARMVE